MWKWLQGGIGTTKRWFHPAGWNFQKECCWWNKEKEWAPLVVLESNDWYSQAWSEGPKSWKSGQSCREGNPSMGMYISHKRLKLYNLCFVESEEGCS